MVNLHSGYHQLMLQPSSRYITTFSTHVGLYRYKRLSFRINSAAEVFQHTIQSVLDGNKGVRNVSDDIIIFGKDQQEHDAALDQTLKQLHRSGLTINLKKCEFNKTELEFFGYVFSKDGIAPDPKKVQAVQDAKEPQNPSEVRSFLGMAQYSSRFLNGFATMTEPLRKLTKHDVKWSWDKPQADAFQAIKDNLAKSASTAFFDPRKQSELLVDGSPVGVAAILAQDSRPIVYASRALREVEQWYSQTEREALAVVWACEHFHVFLAGAPVRVLTDHKPLIGIWKIREPASPNCQVGTTSSAV